jgi:hypothetical protein
VPSGELALTLAGSAGGDLSAVAAVDDGFVFGQGAQVRSSGMSWSLPALTRDIAPAGGLLYVAAGEAGLQVLSPARPAPLASLATPGLASGLKIVGTRAYLASAGPGGGLQIVDIARPAAPRLIGAAPVYGSASGVDVAGELAYLAGGLGGGLEIFDVSNPLSPALRGALITPGNAQAVAVRAGRAYLAAGVCGLQVLDVTNPAAPRLLGAYPTGGEALALALSGERAFVATGAGGYAVFDLSGAAPRELARYRDTLPLFLSDVAIGAEEALLVGRGEQVAIQLTGLLDERVDRFSITGLLDVELAAGRAFVGLSDGAIVDFDLGRPAEPRRGLVRQSGEQILDLASGEGALYAATGDSAIATLPISPTGALRRLSLAGSSQAIALDLPNARAFVAAGAAGVHLLDLSDPLSPTLQLTIDTPGAALGLAYRAGGPLYVADRSGLRIIDLASRTIIGAWAAPTGSFVQDVAVAGGRAYLADRSGLIVLDVRAAASPRVVGAVAGFSAYAARIEGDRLYLAAGPRGLLVFDLAAPDRPRLIGAYDTPGSAQSIALGGGLIYVADNEGGLLALRAVALTNRVSLPLIGQ